MLRRYAQSPWVCEESREMENWSTGVLNTALIKGSVRLLCNCDISPGVDGK